MPVAVTYPGVYVQEKASGVRTIVGVGTSIALFIGMTNQGPIGRPVLCTSYEDFQRAFGENTSLGHLALDVKLFYMNGGTRCYVMRIANGAQPAGVTLRSGVTGADPSVLELSAKNMGAAGADIRAVVTYSGPQPEATFNIDLYRWETQAGKRVKKDAESWSNLTMDPASPLFAPTFLTQNSMLVDAKVPMGTVIAAANGDGFSISGRAVVGNTPAVFKANWGALLGTPAVPTTLRLSIDGSGFEDVAIGIDVALLAGGTPAAIAVNLAAALQGAINGHFNAQGMPAKQVVVSFVPQGGATSPRSLKIASAAKGDIFVAPASKADLAVPLMLGTAQGGLEVGAFAKWRPAPSGITFLASDPAQLSAFGQLQQGDINSLVLQLVNDDGTLAALNIPLDLKTTLAADPMSLDAAGATSPNGNSDGVREKFSLIVAAVNKAAADPRNSWFAECSGYRLTLRPGAKFGDNFLPAGFDLTGPGGSQAARFAQNVKSYTLGTGGMGIGLAQVAGAAGSDGTAPMPPDYRAAYLVADKEIDLFNLLVLARTVKPTAGPFSPLDDLYGEASVFCQQRRAFLLMNPPEKTEWKTVQDAISPPPKGVDQLRIGLVKDYAALFHPRLMVDDGGVVRAVGPAGAIAGLCGRIDASRGVWKAPAGTEADLRGVKGLEYRFSDNENGVMNPKAINTLRIFPNGIVNWGARTMDGDDGFASEYKYIPIRRLALFIEESLYRGLKWVVFEPNDEPLWAQIRLNVGAFMHDLFRQGAFQGDKPIDAYFVKCDASTTTQTDRNLGIVNIHVGFAPLKPAEFVVITLQQIAGQIEV